MSFWWFMYIAPLIGILAGVVAHALYKHPDERLCAEHLYIISGLSILPVVNVFVAGAIACDHIIKHLGRVQSEVDSRRDGKKV